MFVFQFASFSLLMVCLLHTGCISSRPRSEQSLVQWATPQLHDIDALAKMVDPALNGIYPAKSLSRFADIIALCIQVLLFPLYGKYPDNLLENKEVHCPFKYVLLIGYSGTLQLLILASTGFVIAIV